MSPLFEGLDFELKLAIAAISRYGSANGNAVMKEQRTTVVSFDFAEDPIPPGSYGCGRVETICRLVGILSFLAFAANSALYFMGVSRLGLNGYLEVLLLFCDGVAVLAILIGVSKRKSGLLKPYLIFNTLWILGLFILFVVCLWKIIRGSDGVARSILENLRALKPSDEVFSRSESFQGSRTAATVATLVVMSAMAFVIFVDCLFLHIVYRTFQFFAYLEDQRREENNKKDPL
ncbi:unnamed protein product [Caenorhabditis auriculariae]|uniref:Uncharacterized protein n=1 Tax=Caenorhabditis auriculariae TaxID=2777116 RepID=A0A8S1GRF9_9PELO|nr:unnamed protein product [Caenorhabditis auriculariae]